MANFGNFWPFLARFGPQFSRAPGKGTERTLPRLSATGIKVIQVQNDCKASAVRLMPEIRRTVVKKSQKLYHFFTFSLPRSRLGLVNPAGHPCQS